MDEQARSLDEAYWPFASASAWSGVELPATLWQRSMTALTGARAEVGEAAFEQFRAESLRQAAIETGAVEGLYTTDRGFTSAVAAQAATWEAAISQEKGIDTTRLVRAQLAGYDLALDAATHATPISEAWLRRLHEVVCEPQEHFDVVTPVGPQRHILPKGSYKSEPNHVVQADGSTHSYAPVALTGGEMHRLVTELRSSAFESAQPTLQAAYAHHALTAIHPFADGNGRVARVLASVYILRACSLPFVLFVDQKVRYLDLLAAADRGEHGPFATFVFDRAIDTTLLVTEQLRGSAGTGQSALERLGAIHGRARWSQRELEDAGERLRTTTRTVLEEVLAELPLPAGVSTELRLGVTSEPPTPSGWRLLPASPYDVTVESPAPAEGQLTANVRTLVSTRSEEPLPLANQWEGMPDLLQARLEDLNPTVATGFDLRLRVWVSRHLDGLLSDLVDSIDERSRRSKETP